MKKLMMFLFAAFLLTGIVACGGEATTTEEPTTAAPRTYVADGDYTAFEVGIHHGAPMVTEVTVTIENDEITGFYIDARQSSLDEDGEGGYVVTWNEQTKKELGTNYGMVEYGGATLEWYEQAELLEAYWLENGYDAAVVTDGEFTNVAGVTISDGGYTALAAEAVQQAKDGVFKAYTLGVSHGLGQIIWAELTVDEDGEATDLVLDTLQGDLDTSGEEAAQVWKAQSKQELGDDYGMVEYGGATLEWFEQANLITDYILDNGLPTSFTVAGVDDLSAVTISTGDYELVLPAVFDKVA